MPKKPKNKDEKLVLSAAEEHFLVTGILFFFHKSLLTEAYRRRQTAEIIKSNNQSKSIVDPLNTIAVQLLPMLNTSLEKLEQGLPLDYKSCYEDKTNLKEQIEILYEEKGELLWGINTKSYKKHQDLMIYQIFLPIAHACVSMGSASLQRSLSVAGAFKTEFGFFLFSCLREHPTYFPFVAVFFDLPTLHGISVRWLKCLMYLQNDTPVSTQKLQNMMRGDLKKNALLQACITDTKRGGSVVFGGVLLSFFQVIHAHFNLTDDKLDKVVMLIEKMLKDDDCNPSYKFLLRKLEKLIEQINVSEKLPDYYFQWIMDILKTIQHDVVQLYMDKDAIKKLFDLMVRNQDLSIEAFEQIDFFLEQLEFNPAEMPEQGIPLNAVLYRPKATDPFERLAEHACAFALSKHVKLTDAGLVKDTIDNRFIEKMVSHDFWKSVVNQYKQTPEMQVHFLKKIANIWNERPHHSVDVLSFQDFILSTQEPAYFQAWEDWTFGRQAEWQIQGLVGLATFFETHVPDSCLIKRNSITQLQLLDGDYVRILQALLLEKKHAYLDKNVHQKYIEAWASRRLMLLMNWISIPFKTFTNLYYMGVALGQDYMVSVEDIMIEQYLHRTSVQASLGQALLSLSPLFSDYIFVRYHQENPYSNIQIRQIQQQLSKLMQQGQMLDDTACVSYFNAFSQTLKFLCFSHVELSYLGLKLAVDPVSNRIFVDKAFQELIEVQVPRHFRANNFELEQPAVRFWKNIMGSMLKLRAETPNPVDLEAQRQQLIQCFQRALQALGGPVVRRPDDRAAAPVLHAVQANNHQNLNVHIRSVHKTVAESVTRLVKRYIQIEGESLDEKNNRISQKRKNFVDYPILKTDPTLYRLFWTGLAYAYEYDYVEPLSKISLKEIVNAIICALMDPDAWPNIQALQTWRLGSVVVEPNEYEHRLKAENAQRESIINDTYLHFRDTVLRYLREYSPDKGADHHFLIEKKGFEEAFNRGLHDITRSQVRKYAQVRESIKAEIRRMPEYQGLIQAGVVDPFITDDNIKCILNTKIKSFVIDKLHRPSCPGGIVNYMVYALQGVHPDIRVDVMSKETVTWRLSAAVREAFYNFFDMASKQFLAKDALSIQALKNKFLEEMNACVDLDSKEQIALCFFLQTQMKALLDEPEYRLFLEQNKNDPAWATADAVIAQFKQSSLPYLPILGAIQEQLLLGFRDQCLQDWKRRKKACLTDEAEYCLERLKQDWQTKGFLLENPEHRGVFEDILQTQRLQTLLMGSYPALWETESQAEAWLRKVLMHGLARDAAQEEDKDSIFRRLTEQAWVVSASSSSMLSYKRVCNEGTQQAAVTEDMPKPKRPALSR